MTLLFDNRQAGRPGIHAVLIGVGKYPNLNKEHPAGQASPYGNFSDLTSPRCSVEALAQWIQADLMIQGLPLRTLRVLASSPSEEALPSYDDPTFDSIKSQVGDWFNDIDEHEDNFAFFYFCGHGVKVGDVHSVFAQDFDFGSLTPFERAFNPERFSSAVRRAKARRQLFLVDSCSASAEETQDFFDDHPLETGFLVQARRHNNLAKVKQAYLSASEFGTAAYGERNKPTLFVSAFLKAALGAGAVQQPHTGQWVVSTDSMKSALSLLAQASTPQVPQEAQYGSRMSSNFEIHQLALNPVIPVRVSCAPVEISSGSDLHVNQTKVRGPSVNHWDVDLPLGSHHFQAMDVLDLPPVPHGEVKQTVFPPFSVVSIPCGDIP